MSSRQFRETVGLDWLCFYKHISFLKPALTLRGSPRHAGSGAARQEKVGVCVAGTEWMTTQKPGKPTVSALESSNRCVDVGGRRILLDPDGFVWDAQDWSEELAEVLARESGLETLHEVHWRALRFVRDHYLNTGRAPRNRRIREGTGLALLEIERLFPQGIHLGLRRLAGLPASVKGSCD